MNEDLFYDARKGLLLVPKEKSYIQTTEKIKELEERIKKLELNYNLLWQRVMLLEKL